MFTATSKPLLSICVPTYKRPILLKKALESLKSDDADIEIIVCDNSSGEENQSMVEGLLSTYTCDWQYNINNLPAGMSNMDMMIANFNICVDKARGEFVYILHDDDYLLPGGLSKMLKNIRKYRDKHPLLMFGVDLVDANEKVLRRQYPARYEYLPPAVALKKLLDNSSFVRWPSIVLKKEIFIQVGKFDASKKETCDIDLWVKTFSLYGVFTVPEPITAYRIHDNAQTTKMFNENSIAIFLELFDLASQKHLLSPEEIQHCKARFFHQWILAGVYRSFKKGDFAAADHIMDLFQLSPMRNLSVPVKWMPFRFSFNLLLLPYRAYSGVRSIIPAKQTAA
jgi:glycosyltransferase involved in cell wall biosynthesis